MGQEVVGEDMTGTVSFDFSDQVVLVTGAAGALGSSVVETFKVADATVVAVDITEAAEAKETLELAEEDTYYQADLTDETAVEDMISKLVGDHGGVDALCNIAGTWRGGNPLMETDEATFDMLVDVNLRTMFLTSKFALPHLVESGGAIVSVASRSSLEGGPRDGPYRATKAGVRILTETIATEHLGEVRANAVMPSVLDTPMNREMMEPSDDWVDPDDVARMIAFLCSDGATVTSGASVPVYGEA